MDPFDKAILASVFASAIEPSLSPIDRLRMRTYLPLKIINDKIHFLVSNGLLEGDPIKLTYSYA
jgi:hypothetical protein